ncbi:hypothetical protein J1G33_27545 [Pseudomonas sp. P867]|uniref:hypothetical protein n=1 Tax=Pseudomonas TaxID=286 RepID=UPI0016530EC4|nr:MULTISPECIES: hypothetical protein [Pseudomonas]MBY8974128.1 hypothetical protein [Pseudomonas sp. P867]QUW64550.1 hypothetical protein KFQ04_18250 [Pseudomonas synxantha]
MKRFSKLKKRDGVGKYQEGNEASREQTAAKKWSERRSSLSPSVPVTTFALIVGCNDTYSFPVAHVAIRFGDLIIGKSLHLSEFQKWKDISLLLESIGFQRPCSLTRKHRSMCCKRWLTIAFAP